MAKWGKAQYFVLCISWGKENMKDNQKQEVLSRSGGKLDGGYLRDKNECCIIDSSTEKWINEGCSVFVAFWEKMEDAKDNH